MGPWCSPHSKQFVSSQHKEDVINASNLRPGRRCWMEARTSARPAPPPAAASPAAPGAPPAAAARSGRRRAGGLRAAPAPGRAAPERLGRRRGRSGAAGPPAAAAGPRADTGGVKQATGQTQTEIFAAATLHGRWATGGQHGCGLDSVWEEHRQCPLRWKRPASRDVAQ